MKYEGFQSPSITLVDDDIEKFCDFFHRRTGILFSPAKRYFLEKRILRRMDQTGHSQFRTYFTALRLGSSKDELQALINEMTINETYFFREDHQFDALVNFVLNEIVDSRSSGQIVTIWSIPCSTGEEPYSIAIKLLEDWSRLESVDVRVFGSDIDTKVLGIAEEGIYSDRSVSRMPEAYLRKYFERQPGGGYRLSQMIVDAVDLAIINVTDPAAVRKMPLVDVIFCRNMLIYFDEATRRQVINSFYDQLAPGGFLMLGHSESISRSSSLFRVRKFGDCIAYQKEG